MKKSKTTSKMTTIKSKMLFYTLLIIVLMTAVSVYSMIISNVYRARIDDMFERNIRLNEISKNLEQIDQDLLVYLSTKSSNSLNSYMLKSATITEKIEEAVEAVEFYSEEDLMVMDIKNMVINYLLEADKAVEERRKNDVVAYTTRYQNTKKIKGYINGFINELNIRQLDTNASTYVYMTEQIAMSTKLNIFIVIDLILLSVIIVLRMTNSMLNPIVRLSHSAEDISRGKFDTEEIKVETNDEIQILAKAFNKMKLSIHKYIEELKEKAETEAKLMDQEMENLKMQSLLDNAKLYALQSQMNPHFLFNTINAGVQLSMIEGADRTSEFLESMSRLFRYNVKNLDEPVTIGDEVANITDYFELLKVRFGELITFEFHIDPSSLNYKIPPLTFQPIVENAYIHGLSGVEEGGNIKVQVMNKGENTLITIEDNGVGISREHIKKIMGHGSGESVHKNSTGIGLHNVIQRLELFYKKKELFVIKGKKHKGTVVTISIPNQLEHEGLTLE